jgi:hemerythrin superfamily protein
MASRSRSSSSARSRRKAADAIALLKADHRQVEAWFSQFTKSRSTQKKQQLATSICDALTVHTTIEEEIFYPACKGKIEDDEILEESYVEHDGAKVLIAELLDSEPDAEFYDAKVSVLSEMIKHHVKEEEKRGEGLFAQAKAADLDLEALGQRLMERKEALKEEFADGAKLPPPHTRSFTGHELVQDHPVDTSGATA